MNIVLEKEYTYFLIVEEKGKASCEDITHTGVYTTKTQVHSSNYTEFLEELRSYLGIHRYRPINVKNLSLVGVSKVF